MGIEITEVLRRSEQGVTKPFICRTEDEQVYFVKGWGAGKRSLICEWIAGHLAQSFKLPIAPFTIVNVPHEIIESNSIIDLSDLGTGPAFGSAEKRVSELTITTANTVPAFLQKDLFVFDWWIKNGDRTLSDTGGNPNVFWEPSTQDLIIIDHNQAFDTQVTLHDLLQTHVFRDSAHVVFSDFFNRSDYNERFKSALSHWDDIICSVPEDWWYLDQEHTLPTTFDIAASRRQLERYSKEEFWIPQ